MRSGPRSGSSRIANRAKWIRAAAREVDVRTLTTPQPAAPDVVADRPEDLAQARLPARSNGRDYGQPLWHQEKESTPGWRQRIASGLESTNIRDIQWALRSVACSDEH